MASVEGQLPKHDRNDQRLHLCSSHNICAHNLKLTTIRLIRSLPGFNLSGTGSAVRIESFGMTDIKTKWWNTPRLWTGTRKPLDAKHQAVRLRTHSMSVFFLDQVIVLVLIPFREWQQWPTMYQIGPCDSSPGFDSPPLTFVRTVEGQSQYRSYNFVPVQWSASSLMLRCLSNGYHLVSAPSAIIRVCSLKLI